VVSNVVHKPGSNVMRWHFWLAALSDGFRRQHGWWSRQANIGTQLRQFPAMPVRSRQWQFGCDRRQGEGHSTAGDFMAGRIEVRTGLHHRSNA
jgi:hypothetical protein